MEPAQYGVAPSTVVKWSKRLKGNPAPAKFGGHKTCSLEPHRDFVLAQIEEVPHLTLHKLNDMLPVGASPYRTIRSGASSSTKAARSKNRIRQ